MKPTTRKEKARYKRWIKYLKNSKLDPGSIHNRSLSYTKQRKEPNQ